MEIKFMFFVSHSKNYSS